jgi:hypothetical protein
MPQQWRVGGSQRLRSSWCHCCDIWLSKDCSNRGGLSPMDFCCVMLMSAGFYCRLSCWYFCCIGNCHKSLHAFQPSCQSPFHAKVWPIELIVLVILACCRLEWYHSTILCCNSFWTHTLPLKWRHIAAIDVDHCNNLRMFAWRNALL